MWTLVINPIYKLGLPQPDQLALLFLHYWCPLLHSLRTVSSRDHIVGFSTSLFLTPTSVKLQTRVNLLEHSNFVAQSPYPTAVCMNNHGKSPSHRDRTHSLAFVSGANPSWWGTRLERAPNPVWHLEKCGTAHAQFTEGVEVQTRCIVTRTRK